MHGGQAQEQRQRLRQGNRSERLLWQSIAIVILSCAILLFAILSSIKMTSPGSSVQNQVADTILTFPIYLVNSQFADMRLVAFDIYHTALEVRDIMGRFCLRTFTYVRDKEDLLSWSWDEALLWPRNLMIVNDTFNLLRHLSWYTFTGWILLYALVYDKFKNNYISRIYETDKYGIVLLYWMNILPYLWLNCQTVDQRVIDGELPWLGREHAQSVKNLLMAFTSVKCIAFALIFKNNTSKKLAHQISHIVMVVVLGVLTAWSRTLTFAFSDAAARGAGGAEVWHQVLRAIRYGFFFQVAAWCQDWHWLPTVQNKKDVRWLPRFVNAWVTLWEASLIQETLY